MTDEEFIWSLSVAFFSFLGEAPEVFSRANPNFMSGEQAQELKGWGMKGHQGRNTSVWDISASSLVMFLGSGALL